MNDVVIVCILVKCDYILTMKFGKHTKLTHATNTNYVIS